MTHLPYLIAGFAVFGFFLLIDGLVARRAWRRAVNAVRSDPMPFRQPSRATVAPLMPSDTSNP